MLVVLAALIAGSGIYLSRLNERRNEWNLQGMTITRVTHSGECHQCRDFPGRPLCRLCSSRGGKTKPQRSSSSHRQRRAGSTPG